MLSKIVWTKIESKSQHDITPIKIHKRCYQRSYELRLKANHNTVHNTYSGCKMLSKIVWTKIESKSQRDKQFGWYACWCYQRSYELRLKANHNLLELLVRLLGMLSKIVWTKIESKSQLVSVLICCKLRCYQRSYELRLKANHNLCPPTPPEYSDVIKDRMN